MHRNSGRSFIALLVAGLVIAPYPGAGQVVASHPFGFNDVIGLRQANAVAVSPDGNTVLYRVSYFEDTGPRKVEWHTIDASGAHERTLNLPEQFSPVGFIPTGAALYGVHRINAAQALAIVPLDSAMPVRVFALPFDIHDPIISPDGRRFAVLADPHVRDSLADVRTVVENDRTSVYVLDADGTDGAWWCSNLEDITQVAWSPDGGRLAVMSATPKIGHHDFRTKIDLCTQTTVKRIADLPAPTSGIAWTDGGKALVFAGTTTEVLTPDHVWVQPVDGGPASDRTPNLSGSAVAVVGDPQGAVWVEMHKGVVVEIDRFANGQLTTSYRWVGGTIAGLPVVSPYPQLHAAMAFTVSDPAHSANVAVSRGDSLVKLTHEGDSAIAQINLGEVRVVNWTGPEGTHLEGIATFPAGYRAGTRAPFLVLPHGGPEGNDVLGLDVFARFVAGLGYVVLQPQYRGSTGYGSEFLNAIYQHFGDRAYSDVNSATDFAIAQGWADPNRLAIFGWSAGGFMTAWTVTQTQRYRAAIEGAGITDWLSFIPTSDIAQVDYDARLPEQDATPFLRFSAVMYANRITTPLLILHGDSDLRVPTFQGRELFILLAERGKTVRMVTYPGSPHFPRRAEQVRNIFQEVGNWLEQYNGK
jgi:dipeptidyl aminopeptidase/acylaminoacyl peptidase